MALNKTILKKLNQKTNNNPKLAEFLMRLFEFESESPGWHKNEYSDILEKSCKEATGDENNND